MDQEQPSPRLPPSVIKMSRTVLTIGGLTAVAWSLLYLVLTNFL